MGFYQPGKWLSAVLGADADSVQVQLSPQASVFFFKCCTEKGLPHLELLKYVWTRWSSMYDLLEHAFLLKAVRNQKKKNLIFFYS